MCLCSAGIIERSCVEIDGFNVCVLLEIFERVYAEIDGFNVCVFCWNLVTVDMLGLLQHGRCVFMPKLSRLQRISIRCRIV
jgi:hypothetical protein